MSVFEFQRTGELLCTGDDLKQRPDTVEFTARAGQAEVDRLAEVVVTVDRWGTRAGIAHLLESDGNEGWTPLADSLPFDAFYLLSETEIKLVFSEYVRLQPGKQYRLFLAGAVITKPTITVRGIQRAEPVRALRSQKSRRRA